MSCEALACPAIIAARNSVYDTCNTTNGAHDQQ